VTKSPDDKDNRGGDGGRRAEDKRWAAIKGLVGGLVRDAVAEEFADVKIALGKIEDHVDDVDASLRGPTDDKALIVRITLAEKALDMQKVMLQNISGDFGKITSKQDALREELFAKIQSMRDDFAKELREINASVGALTIQKAIAEGTAEVKERHEMTRLERFKEWMKLWGALGIAILALVVPLATLAFQNWDKIEPLFRRHRYDAAEMHAQNERDRRGPRGKAVRLKEINLERARKGLPPLKELPVQRPRKRPAPEPAKPAAVAVPEEPPPAPAVDVAVPGERIGDP
jgi:hypothetical protein